MTISVYYFAKMAIAMWAHLYEHAGWMGIGQMRKSVHHALVRRDRGRQGVEVILILLYPHPPPLQIDL